MPAAAAARAQEGTELSAEDLREATRLQRERKQVRKKLFELFEVVEGGSVGTEVGKGHGQMT